MSKRRTERRKSVEELSGGEDDDHRGLGEGESVVNSVDELGEAAAVMKPSVDDEEETVEVGGHKFRCLALGQDDKDGQANENNSQWEEEKSAEWTSGESNLESNSPSGSESEESSQVKVDKIGYLNKESHCGRHLRRTFRNWRRSWSC
jgi:hypothetical protein